ncbi:MAG TPA: hypothetical protein PKN80_06085 [bacterium]|nr:hypothetical protein [bacterium]HNS47913.1 hypothetical protein [bacterium]
MKRSLTTAARRRVEGIHRLSRRRARREGRKHLACLLEMLSEHAVEIRDLQGRGDRHYLVETGDLALLCLEIMLEGRRDPEAILEECFGRFERKLVSPASGGAPRSG